MPCPEFSELYSRTTMNSGVFGVFGVSGLLLRLSTLATHLVTYVRENPNSSATFLRNFVVSGPLISSSTASNYFFSSGFLLLRLRGVLGA